MAEVIHHQLKQALSTIHAIAHPVRVKILEHLLKKQTVLARDIYTTLQLSPAIASQQLRILKNAGLLRSKRKAKEVWYEPNIPKLKRVLLAASTYCAD